MRILYVAYVLAIALFSLSSCEKTASKGSYDVAVTAGFRGASYQYIAPAGLTKTSSHYLLSTYQGNVPSNTLMLTVDSAKTGLDSMLYYSGNSIKVANNGIFYSTLNNYGRSAGTVNLIVSGNSVSGSFSGTLYTDSSVSPIDSLVVTNGTISTVIY